MEEPTCITICLICESQVSPTNDGNDTDTRASISILKKILIQQNEADVKLEKGNSEAIRLFCPACTEILYEWHEIQGLMSKLLVRSKTIKNRLIVNILQSNVTLPEQLQDSAALQEFLEDFAAVKRAVINEYRPSLQLERLAEIPFDTLRNCFGNEVQNEEPVDLLDNSTGFEHEDYHDDWEAPTFDAAESIEIHSDDDDGSDQLNRKSSSISRHVMTTRKRKRSPIEQCDGRNQKEKHIQEKDATKPRSQTSEVHVLRKSVTVESDESVNNRRSIVELDNGDILYDGKYMIKFCGDKYLCPLCGLQRKWKNGMTQHIREDHIRGKGTNEIVCTGENTFLYLNKYGFTFSNNQYKCTTCGITLLDRSSLIDHIQLCHAKGADQAMDVSKVQDQPKVPSRSQVEEEDLSEPESVENTEEDPHWHHPDYSDNEVQVQTVSVHSNTKNLTSEIDLLQKALNTKVDKSVRKRWSLVELDNGDFVYAGKYTVKFCGSKYLCPVCGLQRKGKHSMTDHILEDHIRGEGTNEIAGVGENSFLYRNQYGFTFSRNRYKCTTCGNTENKRQHMIDHLKLSHINGEAKSSSQEQDVNEAESVENSKNPDRYCPESSDSEEENEQDSDEEEEPVTQDIKPPSGPRKLFRWVPIAENLFLYAGKYRIVFKDGRYRCPKCSHLSKTKNFITEHIRRIHLKSVISEKVQPKLRIVALNENEFMYGDKYRITKKRDRYFCSECPRSCPKITSLTDHIRSNHIFKKAGTEKAGRTKRTILSFVEYENGDILYDGKYSIKFCGNKYLCPLCGLQRVRKTGMTVHIREDHIRGKGTNEIVSTGENTFLYLNQYGFTFSDNQYKCTTCGTALPDRSSLIDHVQLCHAKEADQSMDVRKVKGQPKVLSKSLDEQEDVNDAGCVENTEQDPDWHHPESSDSEMENETLLTEAQNQTYEVDVLQETLNKSDKPRRKKGSVVTLDNGDILYDGKYTIRLYGKKYLCPVCALQRSNKYDMTEHILGDHIRGKGSNEITSVGENTFLYLNQYGFTFSKNRYKCTTCGNTENKRLFLIDHMRLSHKIGADQAKDDGKVVGQPEVPSSSLDVNEPESATDAENPDRDHAESLHSEEETEEDSGAELEEPVTEGMNNPPGGPRNKLKCVPIAENVFMYAGKYRVALKNGRYKCPKCPSKRVTKAAIMEHIRKKHLKCVISDQVQPRYRIVALNENEFMYADKFRIKKMRGRYFCSECPTSCPNIQPLTDHIRYHHIWKSAKDNQSSEKKPTAVTLENGDLLYDGKYTIKLYGKKYLCPVCGLQKGSRSHITEHIWMDHIQANGPTTPVITPAGENTFLYLNQYGFTFSNNQYQCTTCGIAMARRPNLIDHIQFAHADGADQAADVSMVKGQANVPSSSLIEEEEEEEVHESESVENTEEDPDWHHPESSDSEVENETLQTETDNQTSEVDVLQEALNRADESVRKRRSVVALDNGDILYDGKYTIRFFDKMYLCPFCGLQLNYKYRMIQHIREDHIRGKGPTEFTAVGENTFLYLNQYGFTCSKNGYQCTTCGMTLDKRPYLIDHIQVCHVNAVDKLATDASVTENSPPEDTLLPPEVSETCTIETSQPEDTPLPPEVSETCTVETSQPEGTQIAPNVQRHDISETLKAIQSIKCEAVKIEAVHMESENQSSGYNLKIETFNAAESHDETGDKKRIRRTVVVLENGDVLYDGKYNIKFLGKKYLCPVCGLQRNKKYALTEHIRVDHIVAKAPTTPEVTAVGENSFLYLNQYGFSCSNDRYKCTTCGITLPLRNLLFDHIQVSHVNGKDKAIHVGKGKAQAQSSSLEDANEPESVQNTEEDPDRHPTDSTDKEAQSEQESDNHQEEEPAPQNTKNPPSGPRRAFRCIPITENEFLYAGKYRVVLKGGLYKCPKCSCMLKHKFAIMDHIRVKHLKCVVSQKVQPFNRIVTISENEFVYGGKYRITKMKNRYFCSECPTSRSTILALSDHVRQEHIRKKEVPEPTRGTEGQSTKPKTGSHILRMKKIGPNEYLLGGQVPISVCDGVYKCGSCGAEKKTLALMRYHAIQVHIRRATDQFFSSVQTLEDGTLKCGKCDFIGKNWNKMDRHIECHKRTLKNTGSAEITKKIYSVEVSPNQFDHGGWPYSFVPETGRYNCGSCNWTFPKRRNIIRHVSVWHKNPVEQAVCDECGKTFANKDYMRSHKIRHGPKTVPCPECDRLFANQDDLKGHMKTHLGEAAKTQVCEFCGKGFHKPNQLEKHRATHTGEAPYSCDDCGLGYYTQRELKNHQKIKHPKETASSNVPPVDTNEAVVSIEIVDGVITDINSM